MADMEAGKIDCVVVYKVDRLSRSLLDFGRLMEVFDRHKVAFVCVTQPFNTSTSMGRLVLHVLLSFAQFERELIGERTRDKIRATRQKGKYAGGRPVLGYEVDPHAKRLLVHPEEAARVRILFALYQEHSALLPVVEELQRRGWTTKRWTGRKGQTLGGMSFTRTHLHRLLTNPLYRGQIRYKGQLFPGEQPAIIDEALWNQVQTTLRSNQRGNQATPSRHRPGALLQGLLRCGACDAAMAPCNTRKGSKQYRYYGCNAAMKRGDRRCPARSVPAGEVERAVVEQLRMLGRDPEVLVQSLQQARLQDQQHLTDLEAERRSLGKDQQRWKEDLRRLAQALGQAEQPGELLDQMQERQGRMTQAERRLLAIGQEMQLLRTGLIQESDAASALSAFGPVWESLEPHEQVRLVRLVVDRVIYNGQESTLTIQFHPLGLRSLAEQLLSLTATREKRA
jgi:site-specific DNA recombinase